MDAELDQMLARAAQLAAVRHTERAESDETWARLKAHGLDDAEIERQLASLKWNTADNKTAAITTYSYLHGLQHLDALAQEGVHLAIPSAATVTLFQGAEICLFVMGTLSERMLGQLTGGRMEAALSCIQWRNGFQDLLYRLALLAVEMGSTGAEGAFLRIEDSPAYRRHREHALRLQHWMVQEWKEEDGSVFGKNLSNPQRNAFFHEFVNTGQERIWASLLARVLVPGMERSAGENDGDFYARTVGSTEIERMVTAMETEAETELLPFRAVHQITETVAGTANTIVCRAVASLLSGTSGELDVALEELTLGNRLLSVVDECIRLMQRALTPNAYSAVRPNLGMVAGTSSTVLRKTLFNASYPLLVRSYKLRMMGFSGSMAGDDPAVEEQARQILRGENARDPMRGILRQLVSLHQHVRTWRDNHIQLPKTHLGMTGIDELPTVSLSGSHSAVTIAHELRKAHAKDPIIPLYRALLGVAPPDVHEVVSAGEFDEYMAGATAREVFDVYSEVQERFKRRCPFTGQGG